MPSETTYTISKAEMQVPFHFATHLMEAASPDASDERHKRGGAQTGLPASFKKGKISLCIFGCLDILSLFPHP